MIVRANLMECTLQTKNIDFYLGVIGRLFDDLGGHPEGRADKGVAFDLSVGELPRHTEICQLHLSLLGQQHVGSCGTEDRWEVDVITPTEKPYLHLQFI